MDISKLEYLKRQYGFEEWRDRDRLQENLLIWKFFPGGDELSGWQPRRIQRVLPPDAETGAVSDSPRGRGDAPASIQSLWQRSDGADEALLRLDTFECGSRGDAHEYLLRLLGEFQSPLLRRAETAAGDVAFGFPRETVMLFARANLVLLLRNAGRAVQSLAPLAGQLDETLVSRPEAEGQRGVVNIRQLEYQDVKAGDSIPLAAPEEDEEQQRWYKFFSRSGKLRLERGRPVYLPETPGPNRVTMFVVQPRRPAGGYRMTF